MKITVAYTPQKPRCNYHHLDLKIGKDILSIEGSCRIALSMKIQKCL